MAGLRTRALAPALLVLSWAATARGQVPDWGWVASGDGCATVGGDDLLLAAQDGGCGGQARLDGVATSTGTLTFDLAWSVAGEADVTSFSVSVGGVPAVVLAELCPTDACASAAGGLQVHVDAGAAVALVLDASLQAQRSATAVTLAGVSFAADGPFVDVGGGLDGSRLLRVGGLAGSAEGMALDLLPPDGGQGGGAEVIVGLPAANGGAGQVQVRTALGALRLSLDGFPGAGLGSDVTSLGDLDGSGSSDFAAGAPGFVLIGSAVGLVAFYSGSDGGSLGSLVGPVGDTRFGAALDGGADVDADGTLDLVVGAPGADDAGAEAGRAWVFSGSDLSPLYILDGDGPGEGFGSAVALVGDTDGDGFVDVAVGAPTSLVNVSEEGRLRLYSGATGELLAEFIGQEPGARLGHSVSSAGDLDLDGFVDMVTGAPGTGIGGNGFGFARGLAGESGNPFFEVAVGNAQFHTGSDVAAAGDVNGDGFADVLVGAPSHVGGEGRMFLIGGPYGEPLLEVRSALDEVGSLGAAVAAGADVDGDGAPDLVGGLPLLGAPASRSGGVLVLTGELAVHGAPRLSGLGELTGGSLVTFTVSDGLPLSLAWLIVGATRVDLPFLGGVLVPAAELAVGPLPTRADGGTRLAVSWPVGVPAGVLCWMQAWVADPAGPQGFTATNALRLEVP